MRAVFAPLIVLAFLVGTALVMLFVSWVMTRNESEKKEAEEREWREEFLVEPPAEGRPIDPKRPTVAYPVYSPERPCDRLEPHWCYDPDKGGGLPNVEITYAPAVEEAFRMVYGDKFDMRYMPQYLARAVGPYNRRMHRYEPQYVP